MSEYNTQQNIVSRGTFVQKLADLVYNTNQDIYPPQMPKVPTLAAEWLVGLFRGQGMSADAQIAAARTFFHGGYELQQLVISSAADGIGWRGDTIDEFKTIIAENLRILGS